MSIIHIEGELMRPYFLFLFIRRIRAIKYLIKDSTVPWHKKALVIFGIIYLLSPIDLIPAPVLGFGIIDDVALWVFILSSLKEQLDKYYPQSDAKTYNNKNVIDAVDYEVKIENKDKEK